MPKPFYLCFQRKAPVQFEECHIPGQNTFLNPHFYSVPTELPRKDIIGFLATPRTQIAVRQKWAIRFCHTAYISPGLMYRHSNPFPLFLLPYPPPPCSKHSHYLSVYVHMDILSFLFPFFLPTFHPQSRYIF